MKILRHIFTATVCAIIALSARANTPGSLDFEIDGEWVITKVGDKDIREDAEMPYVNFDSAHGRFYSSNGCNLINGSYSVGNGNAISFSHVLSTMKACPGNDYQGRITSVLSERNTVYGKITQASAFTTLTISDSRGHKLLTLQRHNLNYLDGMWRVASINGKLLDDEEVNIFFDVDAHCLHGNTGCNYFNGEMYIDPSQPNTISFAKMGVTRMNCPKSSQETEMLVALEDTTSCHLADADTVTLLDSNGRQLLSLKRMNDEN